MATKIVLQCIDRTLEPVNLPKLTSGGKKDITLEVQFDSSWAGYTKTATFWRDKSLVYHATMRSDTCEVPWSVAFDPGVVNVGVFGVSDSIVKTTEDLELIIEQGAIPGQSSADPIPSIYQQLLNAYGAETDARAAADAEEQRERKIMDSILGARITDLSRMAEGSTTGDAELIDARVGYGGGVFENVGDAIRSVSEVQVDITESVADTVHLAIDHSVVEDMGFATTGDGKAMLQASAGVNLYTGVIPQAGYYDLPAKTLLSRHALNNSNYVTYLSYDAEARADVFIAAGTHFYVLGVAASPQQRTVYCPEHIIVAMAPERNGYSLTAGAQVTAEEMEGLLTEGKLQLNAGRYTLYGFPVTRGTLYRLQCDSFVYPAEVYQLFGFVKTMNLLGHLPYIPGGVRTNAGTIDILVRAPIDGYLMVSNDTNTPSAFTLTMVTATRSNDAYAGTVQPYHKLLTIGDSLSGNTGLWQPTAIDMLNIPEYGILGGAGLTVADQGASVNTIYNRVMAMEADASVDLITFWGGFNDFNSDIELSSMDEQLDVAKRDASTFYGGVLNCVEKILTTYPLKQLVMIGTTPFYVSETWKTKTNSLGLTIEDYVAAFREVAEYYSIPFLDLLHTSGFNDYNYATYYLDQGYWLHPNSTGHALVGRKIAGFIKSLEGSY